jgi:hypothetical protein
MIKTKLIDIPIYNQKLMLVDCNSPKELRKLFKGTGYDARNEKKKEHDIYADTISSSIKVKGEYFFCIYVVLNSRNSLSGIDVGTLAHECTHVMQFIYKLIGESFSDGEILEHDAYFMGYLVNELCKFMNVKTKIKPRN